MAIQMAIQEGGGHLAKVINAVLEDLCTCKFFEKVVYKFVLNNGGSHHKAEEVLEEGLIKLSELIRNGKYEGGKLDAFAIQICKNIWLNMRRKKDEQVILPGSQDYLDAIDQSTPEKRMTGDEKSKILKNILANCLDESCLKLLELKIVEGVRHEKIAKELGLANANSSKEKLNRCKKNAMACIEKSPHYMALMESVDFFVKKNSKHGY